MNKIEKKHTSKSSKSLTGDYEGVEEKSRYNVKTFEHIKRTNCKLVPERSKTRVFQSPLRVMLRRAKKYILLVFLFLIIQKIKAQQWKVDYIVELEYFTLESGQVFLESGSIALAGGVAGDGIFSGSILVNGKPNRLIIVDHIYNNFTPVIITLPTSSCYNYTLDKFFYASGASFKITQFTVEPIFSLNETLSSPSGSGITYCEDENITLVVQGHHSGYNWQYRINNGGWGNFNPPGSGNSRTFKFTDVFSSGILTENINFRLINCNGTPSTNNVGPYVFNPIPAIVENATVTPETCFGNNTAKITINNTSRSPVSGETFEYQLYKQGNTPVLYSTTSTTINASQVSGGLPPDNYKILIVSEKDANATGCGVPTFYPFTLIGPTDAVTTANAGTAQLVCNSTASLLGNSFDTADEEGKWTTSGSGTIANPGNPTTTVTGLDVGNNVFSWTITQDFGCTTNDEVTITRLNVSTSNAGADDVVCASSTTLDGNMPGGGENGIWTLISGSGGFSNSAQSNTTVNGLSEGINTFRWTIQDNGGACSQTDDVTVTYTNITTPIAGTDQQVCPNDVVTLGANSIKTGETGTWSVIAGSGSFTNANSNTSQVSGLSVGTNTLRWTISDNGGNCPLKTDDIIISISDLSVVEVTTLRTNPGCFGNVDGSITVIGSGGTGLPSLDYEFTLSNGNQVFADAGQEVIFTGLAAGAYTFTIRDNSCTIPYSQTIILTNPPAITATETLSNFNGYQLSCNGTSDGAIALNVTGGASGYTYSWDSGQTTKDIAGLTAGSYTVTITDANSCTENFTYNLAEPFVLTESIITSDYSGTNISCNGAADGSIDLDITGGTAPYSYSWSTGAITQDLASLGVGSYSVTVTDANNCSQIINPIILNEPDVLSLSVNNSINIQCNGTATGEVTLLSLGGGAGKQYSLDGVNYQTGNVFSGLVAGSYVFDVVDVNGCNNQVNLTLTEPTLLTATIGSVQNTTCGDLNGTATIEVTGGVTTYAYTWRDAVNAVVGNTSVLSGVGGGIYEVTVVDANGCSIMQSANISSIDGPQTAITGIQPTTCFNSLDGAATLNITGSAPFDVAWANGETGLTANSLQPGNNSVVITDANGCVAVEVVTVPSPSAIDLSNVSQTAPTCYNSTDGAIIVDATGGSGSYSYAWSNGTSGNQLSGVAQGTYTLTITDSNGCTLVQDIELNGVEPITTTLVSETIPTCKNGTDGSLEVEALGGNGNYTYAWSNGQFGSTLSAIGAGLYDVTITDVLGCTLVQTFDLSDADPFVIDPFNDIIEICTGSSYKANYSLNNASYTWTSANGFTSTSNEVVLNQAGNYTLTVINENGCMAQDNFELVLSNDLLNADFLLISEAYVGDTVFIVDISWPVPDLLDWEFANNVTVLEQGEDYAAVVFNEPDIYAINMTVQLADCSDFYIQSINILDRSEKEDINGRISGDQELIQRFDIYPNPNYGNFQINIELSQTTGAQVQLIDLQRNRIILDNTYKDELIYSIEVNRIDLSAGLYLVTLKVQDEFKARRIMIR